MLVNDKYTDPVQKMQEDLTKQLMDMRKFLDPKYAYIDEGLTEEDKKKAEDIKAFNNDIIFPM